MATKKKAENTVKTYTLEEARKLLAEQKQAAKESRKGRAKKKGFHADPVEENDTLYNVLAKGEYSNGEGRLVEIRAVMAAGGKVRVAAYPCGPWVKGVSAVGDTVEEASAALAVILSECAEALTEDDARTVETLDKNYNRLAGSHEYNPPKQRK